jgi:hypothetical protein
VFALRPRFWAGCGALSFYAKKIVQNLFQYPLLLVACEDIDPPHALGAHGREVLPGTFVNFGEEVLTEYMAK